MLTEPLLAAPEPEASCPGAAAAAGREESHRRRVAARRVFVRLSPAAGLVSTRD